MNHVPPSPNNRRLVTYAIGFLSSVALTILAYAIVVHDSFSIDWTPATIAFTLAVLAMLQLVVQLMFFLHLGEDDRPRWKLITFAFALIILGIIVIGSLWIMFDLNSRMMMSSQDMIKYMNKQTGL